MTPPKSLQGLLQAIVEKPADEANYLVMADWLEENEDPRRAELLRLHRKLLATCCEPERHPERAAWQTRIVALLAEGVKPCVPRRSVELGAGVEMTFSFIPPGKFLMGRPVGESGGRTEVPQHRVTLTKGFHLGVHQVTQSQWLEVTGNSPSRFKGDSRPVEMVSWEDCQEFCRKLGERCGKQSRLPTEAEWEYACRAGTTTEYHSGSGLEGLRRVGWCSYDGQYGSAGETTPVGQFQPNAWGLYDMHGNVFEWCLDGMRVYASGNVEDPLGAEGKAVSPVRRGGSWGDYPFRCRAALRSPNAPSARYDFNGCRVVLCLD
jgi:uncharacterized protein (TIGR02996 family)